MTLRRPFIGRAAAAVLVASAMSTAACGGNAKADSPTTSSAPIATAAATVSTTSASPAGNDSTTAEPVGTKVNANTASTGELQAAFESVGVTSAKRWAQEVDEYRPYSDDPAWAKLRSELGKYNIAPATLAKIISVLEV